MDAFAGWRRLDGPLGLLVLSAVLISAGFFHGLACAQGALAGPQAMRHDRVVVAVAPHAPSHAEVPVASMQVVVSDLLAGVDEVGDGAVGMGMLGACVSMLAAVTAMLVVQRHKRLVGVLAARLATIVERLPGRVAPRAPALSQLCVLRA